MTINDIFPNYGKYILKIFDSSGNITKIVSSNHEYLINMKNDFDSKCYECMLDNLA